MGEGKARQPLHQALELCHVRHLAGLGTVVPQRPPPRLQTMQNNPPDLSLNVACCKKRYRDLMLYVHCITFTEAPRQTPLPPAFLDVHAKSQ